jgi:hypothetical protein
MIVQYLVFINQINEGTTIMKAIKANLLLILLILSFLLAVNYSSAKPLKSQISLLRDCRLYEESYEGISCRNASFEDIPVCTSDEEIITSPKRGRLCCCIRVKDDEIEGVKEGETPSSGGDCRDVGCVNPEKTSSKEVVCEKDKIPLLFDSGAVTCCCAKDKATKCQIIGCSEGGPSAFCNFGYLKTRITHETQSGFSQTDCCCPTEEGRINLGSLTCSHYIGCDSATVGTSSSCPTDLQQSSITIDVSLDGTIETSKPCCCKSITKSDIKTK